MTPQLQQAIALLQLSSTELETKIAEALESNPMLERTEAEVPEIGPTEISLEQSEEIEKVKPSPDDEGWDRHMGTDLREGATGMKRNIEDSRPMELADPEADDLMDHLLWQLNLSRISEVDEAIAMAIIDALNADGYLTETIESLQEILAPDLEVDLDEIESVLHRVQRFDPVGVGARNLRECLTIQLDLLDEETPGMELAKVVVDKHLDLLGSQSISTIVRKTGATEEKLSKAIGIIRGLEPRPGSLFDRRPVDYVRPDVLVEKRGDDWTVRVPGEASPPLKINGYYADLVSQAKGEDQVYMRDQLQEARWLIRSLATRNETLVKVAAAIVDYQKAFFEDGPEAMKPLVLREIADVVDLHESTVSRVTTRKFMLTPRGLFEFKYFFSSHVGTSDGGECSATAIQAMIGKLIESESPKKPLSDAKIASILNDRGIDVARRTVAKYREALNIPASSKRKRLI